MSNLPSATVFTPADFERAFSLDTDAPLPSKAAVQTLIRASSSPADSPVVFQPSPSELARMEELRIDGCDMIKAAYLFLELLDCPSQARDFVVALMGISRGDTTSELIIPDDVIIRHTGWSRQTAINKRRAFKAWAESANLNLIEIVEADYVPGSGKYEPTKYRVVVSQYVAQFVQLARERDVWDFRSGGKLNVERAIESGLDECAEDVARDIPTARLVRRKRFTRRAAPDKQATLSQRREQIVTTLKAKVFDWAKATRDMGLLLEIEVSELQDILQQSLNAGNASWERDQQALKERRQ